MLKKPIIVANWKSFKNPVEAQKWAEEIGLIYRLNPIKYSQSIILCAPFIDIPILKDTIKIMPLGFNFVLGAQNISTEENMPETGETTADMIKDYVSYVLVGHSERRNKLGETKDLVNNKIKICISHGLKTIVCISSLTELEYVIKEFPSYSGLILYEPKSAIGSGKIENPKDSNEMANKIKSYLENTQVLYGGSVNSENVADIISQTNLDGIAIGGASLDPLSFWKIIKNAIT